MGIFRRLKTSGGEGSETYPFKFTILVPTAGVTFTLPLVDYGALTPNIVVDWGDGTATTAISSSTSASRIHTYSAVGSPTTYTITIYGFMPGFRVNNNASIRNLINGIIQFGTVGLRTLNFQGCINLISIPSSASMSAVGGYEGLADIETFGSFMRSTGITSIPTDIFQYSTRAIDFANAFATTQITSISTNIFQYNTLATSFASCFLACTALTSVPSTLFDTNTNVINFSSTFQNCRSLTNVLQFTFNNSVTLFSNIYNMSTTTNALTGTAPTIWLRTPTPTGTAAFRNCINLTNFASIPSNFK